MNLKKISKEQVFKITAIPLIIIVSCCSLVAFLGNNDLWSNVDLRSRNRETTTQIEVKRTTVGIEGREDIEVLLEIADTDTKRTNGLMNRHSLPENEGMLFVFDREQLLTFWMKDTYISLDIAFLDANKNIIDIHANTEPLNTDKKYWSSSPAMYAIELNSGWFGRNDVHPGDSFNFFLD